jgi:predicted enzyme related to lactoylglutathione lyase
MGERTEHAPGLHSWADLATSDSEAAKRFYSGLFGWEFEDLPAGDDRVYSMARIDGKAVAALFDETGGPMPPHWNCYVTVASADEIALRVEAAGGKQFMPPFDVMDAGRMLIVQDPTGAFLSLWEPRASIGAELVNVPGALTWNDLNTSDPDAARAFYEKLLGWTFEESEIAPGEYWVIKNGDRMNGGMRPLGEHERAGGIPSHWLPYFAVADLDRAMEYVGDNGGTVMFGPMPIGDIGRIAGIQDPQGAVLVVSEGQMQD